MRDRERVTNGGREVGRERGGMSGRRQEIDGAGKQREGETEGVDNSSSLSRLALWVWQRGRRNRKEAE